MIERNWKFILSEAYFEDVKYHSCINRPHEVWYYLLYYPLSIGIEEFELGRIRPVPANLAHVLSCIQHMQYIPIWRSSLSMFVFHTILYLNTIKWFHWGEHYILLTFLSLLHNHNDGLTEITIHFQLKNVKRK